jgi:hypothetical protein
MKEILTLIVDLLDTSIVGNCGSDFNPDTDCCDCKSYYACKGLYDRNKKVQELRELIETNDIAGNLS